MLSESTEAERPGYTTSETVIEEHLAKTFHAAPGRILVAVYASNFIRIQQVFTQAQRFISKSGSSRKISRKSIRFRCELGYLEVDEDTLNFGKRYS